MQPRSPIIFWLLLAATITLDLVVISWNGFFGASNKHEMLVLALAFGEVSSLCIWFVFCTRPGPYRWIVAGAVLVAAVLGIFRAEPPIGIAESGTLIGCHVAAVFLAVWLQRIAAMRRSEFAVGRQFSIKNLFVLTTAMAILAAFVGSSKFVQREWIFTAFFIFNNVIVAIGCLVSWNRKWHGVLRFAGALGVALVGGWCLSLARPHLSGDAEILNCVQAIVIFAWLQFGEIIPNRSSPAESDAQIALT